MHKYMNTQVRTCIRMDDEEPRRKMEDASGLRTLSNAVLTK